MFGVCMMCTMYDKEDDDAVCLAMMTLDNSTVGETIDCNIIVESHTLVVNTGIGLTIEQGKTLIPDVYNVFG